MKAYEDTKKKAEKYNKFMNEGGDGYNPYDAELEKIGDAMGKDAIEKENAEWTKEVTIERKKLWNEWVLANQPITAHALLAHVTTLNYGPETLKHHIKRHGL